MEIKNYIQAKNLTITNAAKEIGISRQHLHSIINGTPAGRKLAAKIETWSKGEINRNCILYPSRK